jgi:hypothetical protein
MSAYHKQATSRQRWQVTAYQRAQAPPYLVPHYCLPDRLANHETDPGRLVLLAAANQQVPSQQLPP